MILLDTNVVSETSKLEPDEQVRTWLNTQQPADVFICAITVAELTLGLALMPEGRRKAVIARAVARIIERYGRSCMPFDVLAAREYSTVVMARRSAGRPIHIADAQIAAIALASGCTLATLNTRDFDGINGLRVVNPSDPAINLQSHF